jgi:RNA polymerase sigma-70 factor (ECF subfamily)
VSLPDSTAVPEIAGHRRALYRYIRSLVRDAAEAEDLTQETLLRAYEKLSTLDDEADRFRQASFRNRPRSLDEGTEAGLESGDRIAPVDTAPRLDKLMEQREMSACVQDYIEALPESHRAVILLHDVQGLTNPEIAEMLGVSLATVKIRLHRARKRLRAALDEGCSFSQDERGVKVCEPVGEDPQAP